jgi:hypothetical protein
VEGEAGDAKKDTSHQWSEETGGQHTGGKGYRDAAPCFHSGMTVTGLDGPGRTVIFGPTS